MQIGTIKMSGRSGALVPFGAERWLLCDGQLVAVAAYPALFALIAYTYGGAGAVFALPNYGIGGGQQGRMPVGISGGGYALAQLNGADFHDHFMPFMAPPLIHVPATVTTDPPATTVNINPVGASLLASGGHWHVSDPLDPHPIAAQAIGLADGRSPVLPIGFYIRAL